MQNYLVYRDQIEGFKEVSETVKTVEKIAASSIASLRREMADIETYRADIARILARLSLFHEAEQSSKNVGVSALVVLTSDKGLTGGLWRRTIDEFLRTARSRYQLILAVGSRGEKYLKEEGIEVAKSYSESDEALSYVTEGFGRGELARVDILYPKFISLAQHHPEIVPFLPFAFDPGAKTEGGIEYGSPIIEPARSISLIYDRLLRKYAGASFKKIAAEAKLSECAARTVSMEHASSKTDELVRGLSLSFRTEQRRSLTQKQLESFIAHRII